jgi:hypothetical protein
MAQTTHPASALRGTPLFGFAGKREGRFLFLIYFNSTNQKSPLSAKGEERVTSEAMSGESNHTQIKIPSFRQRRREGDKRSDVG